MGLKIRLKTTYWEKTRSPEEYKEQIQRWVYASLWVIAGNIGIDVFTNQTIPAIINTTIFLIGTLIIFSYNKYKGEKV